MSNEKKVDYIFYDPTSVDEAILNDLLQENSELEIYLLPNLTTATEKLNHLVQIEGTGVTERNLLSMRKDKIVSDTHLIDFINQDPFIGDLSNVRFPGLPQTGKTFTPPTPQPIVQIEPINQNLTEDDVTTSSKYGTAVAIRYDAKYIAVGETNYNIPNGNASDISNGGRAFIYELSGNYEYEKIQELLPDLSHARVSDMKFGNTVLFAPYSNLMYISQIVYPGFYVYELSGNGQYEKIQTIITPSGQYEEENSNNRPTANLSSLSATKYGKRLIAGAMTAFGDQGNIIIYDLSNDKQYYETQNIRHPDLDNLPAEDANMGISVDVTLDGKYLIAGAYYQDISDGQQLYDRAGAAFVYELSENGDYELVGNPLINPDPSFNDQFGISVAISDDGGIAVVGAFNEDNPKDSGRAFVFKRLYNSGNNYNYDQLLGDSDLDTNANFGSSVEISDDGNKIIVGARGDNNKGKGHIFEKDGLGKYALTGVLDPEASNDSNTFDCMSITHDANIIVAGAPGSGTNGAAYVLNTNESQTVSWNNNYITSNNELDLRNSTYTTKDFDIEMTYFEFDISRGVHDSNDLQDSYKYSDFSDSRIEKVILSDTPESKITRFYTIIQDKFKHNTSSPDASENHLMFVVVDIEHNLDPEYGKKLICRSARWGWSKNIHTSHSPPIQGTVNNGNVADSDIITLSKTVFRKMWYQQKPEFNANGVDQGDYRRMDVSNAISNISEHGYGIKNVTFSIKQSNEPELDISKFTDFYPSDIVMGMNSTSNMKIEDSSGAPITSGRVAAFSYNDGSIRTFNGGAPVNDLSSESILINPNTRGDKNNFVLVDIGYKNNLNEDIYFVHRDESGNELFLYKDGNDFSENIIANNHYYGETTYRTGTTIQPRTQVLTEDDVTATSQYGNSVTISDDAKYLAVGEWYNDYNYIKDVGRVFVYELSNSIRYKKIQELQYPDLDTFTEDAQKQTRFGNNVKISPDSKFMYISSMGPSYGFRVTIYELSGNRYEDVQTLPDSQNTYGFGNTLTVTNDNETLFIAETRYKGNTGRLKIYDLSGDDKYYEKQTIEHPYTDLSLDSVFGSACDVTPDGKYFIVSAYYQDISDGDYYDKAGTAFVYELSENGGYELFDQVVNPDPSSFDYFGNSVAISENGGIAVVGALNEDNPTDSGRAFIFELSGNNYEHKQTLDASSVYFPGPLVVNTRFGASIAISNDGKRIIVGDYNSNGYKGRGYIFEKSDGDELYSAVGVLDPQAKTNQNCFNTMAITPEANIIVAGAPSSKAPGVKVDGAVYVFNTDFMSTL